MTKEEKEQWDIFMRIWVIPALKNTWGEKKCKEIVEALNEWEEQESWIPVSERLPENSGNYLITYCLQDIIETSEAVYVKDEEEDKWLDITDIEITLAVIAWMPLPAPYESQESENEG